MINPQHFSLAHLANFEILKQIQNDMISLLTEWSTATQNRVVTDSFPYSTVTDFARLRG